MPIMPDPRAVLAGVALLLLASGGAYVWGRADGKALAQAAQAAAALQAGVAARKVEAGAAAITQDIQAAHGEALAEIVIVRKIIEREVKVHVTDHADRQCIVSAGFVRLHDDAAAGRVPELPGTTGAVDAPSGVALSAVGAIVTANYGRCREVTRQLIDLQDWVRRQKALAASSYP